ncbi:MAG: hypothetical protein PHU85_05700 [Phycisphaerae bacterium]|nr:hypothetical protein [Phycisphaerae bacterium]
MAVRSREGRAAALFLGPNLLGFLIFVAGPPVASLVMAFLYYDSTRHSHFVGLDRASYLRESAQSADNPYSFLSVLSPSTSLRAGVSAAISPRGRTSAVTPWRGRG